jgi:hypothetical protein
MVETRRVSGAKVRIPFGFYFFCGVLSILFPQFTGVVLPGLVRVSLGIENDEEDVDTLIRVLGKIARQPRARMDRLLASMHNGTPFLPQTDVQQQMNDFARAAVNRVYS